MSKKTTNKEFAYEALRDLASGLELPDNFTPYALLGLDECVTFAVVCDNRYRWYAATLYTGGYPMSKHDAIKRKEMSAMQTGTDFLDLEKILLGKFDECRRWMSGWQD